MASPSDDPATLREMRRLLAGREKTVADDLKADDLTPEQRAEDVAERLSVQGSYSGGRLTLARVVADAIREAVAAERAACMASVCPGCRAGYPTRLEWVDDRRAPGGLWIRFHTDPNGHQEGCLANAIREGNSP